jgi:hypothetical protein
MNKKVYYPTYTIDPESIYGSGIVRANKFPTVDTTTSVITGSFPVNKKLDPPVYRSGVSLKPLDTNGYRELKNPDNKSYKLDDFYYTSQQANKNLIPIIKPTFKEKLAQKIKKVANEIVKDKKVGSNKMTKSSKTMNKISDDKIYKRFNSRKLNQDDGDKDVDKDVNKDVDKDVDKGEDEDMDKDVNENEESDNNDSDIDTRTVMKYIDSNTKLDKNSLTDNFGRNKKMWIDDHYLYGLEPRYNSVVYPWRAYTWMYPITPNTDNYYVDNINSSPPDPIIVSNDTTNKGNWQSIYLNTNMLKENFDSENNSKLEQVENKYQQNKCVQNWNILYFIIIILILSIYFNKE